MRGLTQAERSVLASWSVGSRLTGEESARKHGTYLELLRCGRIRLARREADCDWWERTELAHLALRVCPVGEP